MGRRFASRMLLHVLNEHLSVPACISSRQNDISIVDTWLIDGS